MSKVTLIEDGVFGLAGCLNLASVMAYREDVDTQIPADRSVTVNLEHLEVDGSASLALLVHLVRRARLAGGAVKFTRVPERLAAMADLAGLEAVLSFGTDS